MKKEFPFISFTIIIMTALPHLPQSTDSLIMNDSLKPSFAMPKFIPEKNIDYKILESAADSTIDYKILESKPDHYAIPLRQGMIPDSLLKKYDLRKRYKK